jgi:hypothetical protein
MNTHLACVKAVQQELIGLEEMLEEGRHECMYE